MITTDLSVFIGYDSRERDAYYVAKASVEKYSDVRVFPIVQDEVRDMGIYRRPPDSKATTEFTLTRFLTPFLSGYSGMSVFMDCDVLVQRDIREILLEVDWRNDVSCVQHDYTPHSDIKMDGKSNAAYPKKNWSSVMVFNNRRCQILTPEIVNHFTPAYLHRMEWARSIGSLCSTWNYLVGYYKNIEHPSLIHYTDGGPWFPEYKNCEFSDAWIKQYEKTDIPSVSGGGEEQPSLRRMYSVRKEIRGSA